MVRHLPSGRASVAVRVDLIGTQPKTYIAVTGIFLWFVEYRNKVTFLRREEGAE